jgi:hypothetical protein
MAPEILDIRNFRKNREVLKTDRCCPTLLCAARMGHDHVRIGYIAYRLLSV